MSPFAAYIVLVYLCEDIFLFSLSRLCALAKDVAGAENILRQYYCSTILLIHFLCLCSVVLC